MTPAEVMTPAELLASDVVANATMNRGRGLSGVNSYARELRCDIPTFLQQRVRERGEAVWYDACGGEGRALREARRHLDATDWGGKVRLLGVDLVGPPAPVVSPGLTLLSADVVTYAPVEPVDLLTCVHGLHYLGDKLGFLQHAYGCLSPGGLLLGHLDTANLRLPLPWSQLARRVRAAGVTLRLKDHLLRVEREDAALDFGLAYQGATVSEQPNYTGITVIDSWYDVGR